MTVMNYSCYGFFFKQKTAYDMRISDWSSDVCASDLQPLQAAADRAFGADVEDRRAVRRSRLAAIAQGRQPGSTAAEQRIGRLHVDHLGRARPADRPGTAHAETAILIDRRPGILDRGVLIKSEERRLGEERVSTWGVRG